MKKTIARKVYNTDTATEIKRNTYGFFGDPTGYEEILYKTPRGAYFVYGVGGAESKYAESDIFALTEEEAANF